jgi:hypothetical protein
MPNNSRLVGQGKDITTIKFMDSTPAENIGITPMFSAGVLSINLIVVISLPCPTKRELLGILIPVVR